MRKILVDVELEPEDYKTIMGWYEICFPGKERINDTDIHVLHKLMVMCTAVIKEEKSFTSDNQKE